MNDQAEDKLTPEEYLLLLGLARQSLQDVLCGKGMAPLDLKTLPYRLQELGATFVTLTRQGGLRGCIGSLEPYLPLAEDVREHAVAAALKDYRFPPVRFEELSDIRIEISRLTLPYRITFECPEEILGKLRPGVDGVVVRDGQYRATFLPQVWNKIPDPVTFLGHLCQKMGASPDLWRIKKLEIFTYQVEEFHE